MGDLVCRNVLAKPDFAAYTSARPIRLRCYPLSLDGRGKACLP